MKKHLSLIVMALFASAMLFTSCGKEEYTITVNANDPAMGTVTGGGVYEVNATVNLTATANEGFVFVSWNDGNTDNPRTITVTADATYTANFEAITPGIKVSFKNDEWESVNPEGAFFSQYDAFSVLAPSEASGQEFPVAQIVAYQTSVGNVNDVFDGETMSWNSGVFSYVEYYENTGLTDGTYNYGDWWAKSAALNVTEFDATALVVSANLDATMFDALDAYVNQVGMDAAATTTMKMKIVALPMSSSKAPLKTRNAGKKLFVK